MLCAVHTIIPGVARGVDWQRTCCTSWESSNWTNSWPGAIEN